MQAKKLIVGIDPGLNCGLAILSLNGTPIIVESHREWPLKEIIKRIKEIGEPTIISSDVSPAPSLLERLSRKLNAILFEPVISMSVEEKHKLSRVYIERYNINVENVHELDALAAAIKAYQHYKNKFEQVEDKLEETGLNLSPDDVKDLVARGYSISRAIKTLMEKNAKNTTIIIERSPTQEEKLKEIIRNMTGRIMLERERNRLLREINRELQLKVRALEDEIEYLRKALEKSREEQMIQLRRDREYQRLVEEIRRLKNKLAEQETQIELYKQMLEHHQYLKKAEKIEGLILLKPVESFTKEGLERAFKLHDIRTGDIVYILNPSGGGSSTAESLIRRGIKALVVRGLMSHPALEVFEKYSVPVIPAKELDIRWIEGLPYAEMEEIKKLIKEGKTLRITDELEAVKSIIEDHLKEVKKQKIELGQNGG